MSNFTTTQLQALEKAIAAGVTEFTYDGQTTKYRSLNEMISLRNLIRAELGLPSSTTQNNTPAFMSHSKGYR